MRGMILVGLFLTGALTVTATEEPLGQEKKEPKEPYKEFVTVKRWTETGKKFENPHTDVMAFRKDADGSLIICLRAADTAGGTPERKTEITDADGKVYVVTKVSGGPPKYNCYVTPKPADK